MCRGPWDRASHMRLYNCFDYVLQEGTDVITVQTKLTLAGNDWGQAGPLLVAGPIEGTPAWAERTCLDKRNIPDHLKKEVSCLTQ